jgi:hypothetical protein
MPGRRFEQKPELPILHSPLCIHIAPRTRLAQVATVAISLGLLVAWATHVSPSAGKQVAVLNQLRDEINVADGYKGGTPRVNCGPCIRIAIAFRDADAEAESHGLLGGSSYRSKRDQPAFRRLQNRNLLIGIAKFQLCLTQFACEQIAPTLHAIVVRPPTDRNCDQGDENHQQTGRIAKSHR